MSIEIGARAERKIKPAMIPVPRAKRGYDPTVRRIVTWYFERVYGRWEGPGTVPFYCDPWRVGHFAVRPADLTAGKPSTLFRLFVGLAMFQARRDTVIMAQQRAMSRADALALTSPTRIERAVMQSGCELLVAGFFDAGCDVRKVAGRARCSHRPKAECHIKDAARLLNRTGKLGKLPTSAWLRLGNGNLAREFERVCALDADPQKRAAQLVNFVGGVYGVGEKLATMFVSALSVPALAPELTPWYPEVDGAGLLVFDTNVVRVVDALRGPRASRTQEARARWLRTQAAKIDLREYGPDLPRHAPRLVQQAIYSFGSKSNRIVRGDPCAEGEEREACLTCAPAVCPFSGKCVEIGSSAERLGPSMVHSLRRKGCR